MRARLGDRAGGIAERRNYRDLGRAHLEDEEQQAEDDYQKQADNQDKRIAFHRELFLGRWDVDVIE